VVNIVGVGKGAVC